MKETCAIISMRDAVALLAQEKQISYEDALLLFLLALVFMMRSSISIPVSGKKAQNIFSTCIINLQIKSRHEVI